MSFEPRLESVKIFAFAATPVRRGQSSVPPQPGIVPAQCMHTSIGGSMAMAPVGMEDMRAKTKRPSLERPPAVLFARELHAWLSGLVSDSVTR